MGGKKEGRKEEKKGRKELLLGRAGYHTRVSQARPTLFHSVVP